MEYIENLDFVKMQDLTDGKIKKNFDEIEKEVKSFSTIFKDDPSDLSGWGHNYFCEDCGGKLIFNHMKKEHLCSICNDEFKGEKYDSTWLYLYRCKAFEICHLAAILYKVRNNQEGLNTFKDIISFYARNYEKFEIHTKDKLNPVEKGVAGFGKIMPQGLNEAMMLINIVKTLEILKNDLDTEFMQEMKDFVYKITDFLYDQRNMYHNIVCWIDSAIGCAGFFLNDDKLIESAIHSKYGIENQLVEGLTKDSLWYEGSNHYHFFAMEGILSLALFGEIYNYNVKNIKETLKKMLVSAYRVAFDNLVLPNPNDGWPNITLNTYTHIYDMGKKLLCDPLISELADRIYNSNLERIKLPLGEPYFSNGLTLTRIFDDKASNYDSSKKVFSESSNFPDTGFSMLKQNGFNAFMKWKNKSESHAHRDLLTMELTIDDEIISRDLSNCGYGARLYDEWFKKTLAHNTVVINGHDQAYTENSELLYFDTNKMSAIAKDAYNNCEIQRDIEINNNKFIDKYNVNIEKEAIIDYVFHVEAELISELEYCDYNFEFNENGYQHLFDIKKISLHDNEIELRWKKKNVKFSTILEVKNKELIICKSYDNPSTNTRTTLILRSKAKKEEFNVTIKRC